MSEQLLFEMLLSGANFELNNPESDPDKTPRFRGANTTNFWEGKFTIDGPSHCPRQAIVRKRGYEFIPEVGSLLSWHYGRAWEEKLKLWLDKCGFIGMTFTAEEEAQVTFYSAYEEGKVIFTMRPDLLVQYNNRKFPVECKSVQSASTGGEVFNKNAPKLGAVLQLNAAMLGHDCAEGYTLYGLMTYIDGYDYTSKSRFKLRPAFITHHFTRDDSGVLMLNGHKTIVSDNSFAEGLALIEAFDNEGTFPGERPVSVNLFGHPAKYNLCAYCDYRPVCDQYTSRDEINIEEFITNLTMEVNIRERS